MVYVLLQGAMPLSFFYLFLSSLSPDVNSIQSRLNPLTHSVNAPLSLCMFPPEDMAFFLSIKCMQPTPLAAASVEASFPQESTSRAKGKLFSRFVAYSDNDGLLLLTQYSSAFTSSIYLVQPLLVVLVLPSLQHSFYNTTTTTSYCYMHF